MPGVVVVRPEAGLLYFNVEHVRDRIVEHVQSAPAAPRLVVLDLTSAPHVDVHGSHALSKLVDELAARGARTQIVEARASVRERLRADGIDEKVGSVNRFTSVADAIREFQASGDAAPAK